MCRISSTVKVCVEHKRAVGSKRVVFLFFSPSSKVKRIRVRVRGRRNDNNCMELLLVLSATGVLNWHVFTSCF